MIRRTLVGFIVIAGCVSAADPSPRVDREGVPLPTEAVQRFGSAKFLVNNLKAAAFSPDGKTVYTISDADQSDDRVAYSSPGLIAWEVPSGKKLWQVGVDRQFKQVVANPDGKSVWVLETIGATGHDEPTETIRVRYSTTDGKELARVSLGQTWAEALHPTGLAAFMNRDPNNEKQSLLCISDRSGEKTSLNHLDVAKIDKPLSVVWSPSADRLYLAAWNETAKTSYCVAVDVGTTKPLWVIEPKARVEWRMAPDGKHLVGYSQEVDRDGKPVMSLVGWDATTGKEYGKLFVENTPASEVLEGTGPILTGRVHFTADGQTLLIVNFGGNTTGIDVATWRRVTVRLKLPSDAVLSPDGQSYLTHFGRHAILNDVASRRPISRTEPDLIPCGWENRQVQLQFSPTSDQLIRTESSPSQTVWEVPGGRLVGFSDFDEMASKERPSSDAVSADGRLEAKPVQDGKSWQIQVRDPDRPKQPALVLDCDPSETAAPNLYFTPNHRHLMCHLSDDKLCIWEVKNGSKPTVVQYPGYDRKSFTNLRFAFYFRPDSSQVAVLELNGRRGGGQLLGSWSWRIGVYDLPSLKRVSQFEGTGMIVHLGWSRSGQIVGLTDVSRDPDDADELELKPELFRLNPATERKHVVTFDHDVRASAMAPFGDMVAVGSSDGLRLYEASTGRLRHRFREQKRPVQVLSFSPNGRYLAAESVDGPVLVWDVRGDLTKPAKPDAAAWKAAWKALGEDGPESAFRAIRLFALYPDEGGAELAKRFAERKPPSEEAITVLLRKLDDRDFKTREQAGKDLKALGFAAFPALKKALANTPSLELQERATKLLAVTMPPDLMRAERAVEAMLLADTDGCRKRLAEWAKGPASDPLTVAAKHK